MMAQPDFVPADMVAADDGYELAGKHHEVYLSRSDVAPAKMRTVLRQPIRAVERGEG